MHPHIISTTGTKGKSTVTYVLADLLRRYGEDVLRVDTTGYYINGEQKGTLESTKRLNRLVPTVCPGRFLVAMDAYESFTAVLECALGSSGPAGLGYRKHNVGIFTNVFEDHLGSSARLQTQQDISKAKNFIFSRLELDGTAVFNADDANVCSQLHLVPQEAQRIPCGLTFTHFDLAQHLANGGQALTYKDGSIIRLKQDGEEVLIPVSDVVWTFDGAFMPSVWNLMFVIGALLGHFDNEIPTNMWELLRTSRLDPYGGRLTLLKNDQNVTILADYAHEKNSLSAVGDLAKTIAKANGGKVIGVVRLAYDRTDELIADTAATIAPHFDTFVVYDKVDGHFKQPIKTTGKFKMTVGRISQVFTEALLDTGATATRIVREDEALQYAAAIAKPGDVVVHIVNDDITRSINFVRDAFGAELL